MKVSDYVVDFLIEKGITDIFGYPGGMLTHFMDSLHKRESEIKAHINYHEQASSFAACGYAQATHKPGVAFATSGPGATNLITGIANAYFDNIPTIFITGQVNTNEMKNNLLVRQKGFQETDIVSIVRSITKYSTVVLKPEDIKFELEKAYCIAMNGRPGPVLIDIPMNVSRSMVSLDELRLYQPTIEQDISNLDIDLVMNMIEESKRPVIIAGNGIKTSNQIEEFRAVVDTLRIPVVTSMIAFDLLEHDSDYNFGFIGAYGHRHANFIVAKSDLVISIGSRLDVRQVGGKPEFFAPKAKLIRIDIDSNELTNKIKPDEIQLVCEISGFLKQIEESKIVNVGKKEWLTVCQEIKTLVSKNDTEKANVLIKRLSTVFPSDAQIFTDVGQNQVWVAQSLEISQNQRVYFTGGHAAMGYSLPAAIGAYLGTHKSTFSINGDGGFQMNIQELQFLKNERIPIKIIILNNRSLGMISHFQEMYFNSNYIYTIENEGYSVPDFKKIAFAYDLKYTKIIDEDDFLKLKLETPEPEIVEIELGLFTHVFPKLEFGKPNQDQEPLLDRDLYNKIMSL